MRTLSPTPTATDAPAADAVTETVAADLFVAPAARRPVGLWAHLITHPGVAAPPPGAPRLAVTRRNLALEALDEALASAAAPGGAAAVAAAHRCALLDGPWCRPLWDPQGRSVNEDALTGWLATQARRAASDPCLAPGGRDPAPWVSDIGVPLDLQGLALNWPLMWRLDSLLCQSRAPLHALALRGAAPELRAALAALPEQAPAPLFAGAYQLAQSNRPLGPEALTPLMLAAKWDRLGCVEALLDSPFVAIDARDAAGATALWYATDRGAVAIARCLLAHGADAQLCRRGLAPPADAWRLDAVSPLSVARLHGDATLVELLRQPTASAPLGPSPALPHLAPVLPAVQPPAAGHRPARRAAQ